MKLDIFQVIDDQKKCCQKEIIFSLIVFVFFILFEIFLLSNDQKLFAIISTTILIVVMLYKNVKTLIYFCNLEKHPNIDLQKSLNNTIFYSKENYVITKECIVKLDNNIILISYYDIVLIYKYKSKTKNNRTILRVLLRNNSYYDFIIELNDSYRFQTEVCDFSNIILERNPNVLVGKSKENKQILWEKYGIISYDI